MNDKQKRALHGLVIAALCFDPLREIRLSIEPGRPDQEHRYYFHIKGRWRGQFDSGHADTQEHGNYQGLTYDHMQVVLEAARYKVSREQSKCQREVPRESAIDRALDQIGKNKPHAFWQPVDQPIHAPKDNRQLQVMESYLRKNLVDFDPCKPIELVRDGTHYSAKKAPPPHLFVRGWYLNPDPRSNGIKHYDPVMRQHIDRIDDYEAAYAIVEEVLAEFRRVGLVKALCVGLDCTFKGIL